MTSVWVTDASLVTALGNDLEQTWQHLLDNKTAIHPVKRFNTDQYAHRPAACIKSLDNTGKTSMIHALLDMLFAGNHSIPADALLITATTKSGVDSLEKLRQGRAIQSPDYMLNHFPEIVAHRLGLTHAGFNISAACASSTIAVARGAGLIAAGKAEAVLICCLDLLTEFVYAGFTALQILSSDPCRPFDRHRQGMSLGEGAAYLLLMSEQRARRQHRKHLGSISGWGVAGDAAHITAPARDGCGLVLAVNQALETAQLDKSQITAISAHGTGTVYNDLMELTAFERIFNERRVPIYGIKGAIGHTLGAAGGIEAALGLKVLQSQTQPPTKGLSEPEERAQKLVSPVAQSISGEHLLSTNSGFGGINAALILKKGADL